MLRECEDDFRNLVQNARDGLFILSPDCRVAYANKRACEITGYSRDELTTADLRDVAHRHDHHKALQRYQMMIAGDQEAGHIEIRVIHKGGEMLWMELSASKTVWNRQPAVLVIIRDITERKWTEQALLDSCAGLKCLVEKQELELTKSVGELERKCRELSLLKIEAEKINNELLETNNALSILARNINEHRLNAEKSVAGTITSKIMPIIDSLRKSDRFDDIQSGLNVLDAHLQTLTKELRGEMNTAVNLTPSEVQVATMIKSGLKSREIAEKFYISPQTVKTHRRNIRKKLNIQSPNTSLASYLRFVMG